MRNKNSPHISFSKGCQEKVVNFPLEVMGKNKIKILIKILVLKFKDKLQGKKIYFVCVCVCVFIKFSGAWLPKEFNLKTDVDRRPAVRDHRKQESI